ncbi:MAG: MFS transporter [Candidatus Aenigmarchaeota archaeon]|nr:MFS transporter [Candidatus Aenigmarchaeota archaeon]
MVKNLKKDLDYAVKDGVAHSAMMGMGENYLSPYAIALGANDVQVGLLTSIPQLLGSFSQLFSTKITEKIGSRKKMVLIFTLIQTLLWFPIGLLMFSSYQVIWNLILLVTVYWISATIVIPAWTSWVGDLVPVKSKGKFFGKRRTYSGISLFVSLTIAGMILFISSKFRPLLGFGIIFTIAFVSKFISWNYLRKMKEPAFHVYDENKFTFFEFVKRMPKTNFGKFVIFFTLMTFSVNIAAPYFSVYMLKDMGLNYFTYTAILSVSKITSFIFIGIWGKYSDFFGNRKIMALTGSILFLLPALWALSTNVIYLISVQILSGFLWSGFNISTFNFIFDVVSPSKRVRCVSYLNVLNGLAIFLGASLGSLLMSFSTPFWSSFILVLIFSALGRVIVSQIMLPKIKEVKWVDGRGERKLLISVMSDVSEGLKYPISFLSNRRLIVKRRSERVIEEIRKFIEKVLGKRHKYE